MIHPLPKTHPEKWAGVKITVSFTHRLSSGRESGKGSKVGLWLLCRTSDNIVSYWRVQEERVHKEVTKCLIKLSSELPVNCRVLSLSFSPFISCLLVDPHSVYYCFLETIKLIAAHLDYEWSVIAFFAVLILTNPSWYAFIQNENLLNECVILFS